MRAFDNRSRTFRKNNGGFVFRKWLSYVVKMLCPVTHCWFSIRKSCFLTNRSTPPITNTMNIFPHMYNFNSQLCWKALTALKRWHLGHCRCHCRTLPKVPGNSNLHTGLFAQRHLRTVSIDWLACLVWPLDWGWNPEDQITDVLNSVQKAFQNLAENCGPLSETISVGILCNLTTCLMRRCAVSDADGSLVRGTKCTTFENLYNCEDIGVVIGSGESSDKIKCYVWSRSVRDGEGL